MAILEDQIRIEYKVDTGQSELALRRQARALTDQARVIGDNIRAMKEKGDADAKSVVELTRQKQALLSSAAALKSQAGAAREAAQDISKVEKAAQGLGASLKSAILPLIGLTAAATGLGNAVSSFASFEKSLNTIKAVSGATADEIKRIGDASKALGGSTVFDTQQVADSFVNLAKAGFTVNESLSAVPGVLNAAAAAGGDLAGTAEIVAGSLRGFGLDASKAGYVADVLAQSANKSSADIVDLGFALKQLAPTAKGAGQSLEDMAATLSLLADRQIKGADAGSDLRGILIRLVAPPKDAANALKALGVSATDNTGKVRPFLQIIKDLQVALKPLTQQGQIKALSDIGGLENLKSLQALVSLTAKDLDNMRGAFDNVTGAAKKMADIMNSGVAGALGQLGGAISDVFLALGEGLAPAIVDVAKQLTSFLSTVEGQTATKAFGADLGELLRLTVDFTKELIALIASAFKLANALGITGEQIAGLGNIINSTIGLTTGLIGAFGDLASLNFDSLENRLQSLASAGESAYNRIAKKADILATEYETSQGGGGFSIASPFSSLFGGKTDNSFLSASGTITGPQGLLQSALSNGVSNIKGGPSGTRTPSFGTRSFTGGGGGRTKKARAGAKPANLEPRRIQNITRDVSEQSQAIAAAADLSSAKLGAYAQEADLAAIKLKALRDTEALLSNALAQTAQTQTKTTEGIRAKSEATARLKTELVQNKTAQIELANAEKKRNDELEKRANQNFDQRDAEKEQARLEIFNKAQESQIRALDEAYARKLLSANEYYDALDALSFESYKRQNEEIERQIEALNVQKDLLKGRADDSSNQERVQVETQIVGLLDKQVQLAVDYGNAQEKTSQGRQKYLTEFADNLEQSFTGAFEQAVTTALSGGGVINAIKGFGKAVFTAISGQFAKALAEPLAGVFKQVASGLGNALNQVFRGKGAAGQSGGLFGLGKAGTLGVGLAGVGLLSQSVGKGGIGGALGGAAGGALTGAALGSILPGIGTVVGAIGGAILGGAGGLFGKSRKQKRQEQQAADDQKEAKKVTESLNRLLGDVTDTSQLDSLEGTLNAVKGTRVKGKQAFDARKQAIQQVDAAIEARKKKIGDTISSVNDNNLELQQQIEVTNAKPFEQAAKSRQFELDNLRRDTQKALDAFRDSQAAQTAILKNEELKRKLILDANQKDYEAQFKSLSDLLQQRDEIANSDVFTRAKTRSQDKQDSITTIDKQIAGAIQSIGSLQGLGATGLPSDLSGAAILLTAANKANQSPNVLNFTINGATDPNAVNEQVQRGLRDFFSRNGLGDVA